MRAISKALCIATLSTLLGGCTNNFSSTLNRSPSIVSSESLSSLLLPMKIATWNTEHLAYPSDRGCKPRNSAEIAAMRDYVKNLDASIVALQEVASEEAVRLIFPDNEWRIVLSARPNSPAYECRENGFTSSQQKIAFALRKSVEVLKISQLGQFALDLPGLRFGLAITVKTPLGDVDILNLHLKSGCFVDNFAASDSPACQIFARQVPELQEWLRQHANAARPYIVLGDFNHRLSEPFNHLAFTLKTLEPSIYEVTQSLVGCHPRYPAPIDHILVGGLPADKIKTSATMHLYDDMHEDAMLSDHCAVSVTLPAPAH